MQEKSFRFVGGNNRLAVYIIASKLQQMLKDFAIFWENGFNAVISLLNGILQIASMILVKLVETLADFNIPNLVL